MGKPRQGETVNFVFSPSATSASMVCYDSNGVVRPIQPWERVAIDALETAIQDTGTGQVFLADSNAPSVPLVLVVDGQAGTSPPIFNTFSEFPSEGINLSVGGSPYINTGSGIAVAATAQGRVINGKSQGVRPNYRELLTPGGNVGGQ